MTIVYYSLGLIRTKDWNKFYVDWPMCNYVIEL